MSQATKFIASILDTREATWKEMQKIKMKERIQEKMKKPFDVNKMINKLLSDCKSWIDLVISSAELLYFFIKDLINNFFFSHRVSISGMCTSCKDAGPRNYREIFQNPRIYREFRRFWPFAANFGYREF